MKLDIHTESALAFFTIGVIFTMITLVSMGCKGLQT